MTPPTPSQPSVETASVFSRFWRRHGWSIFWSVVVGILFATSWPFWIVWAQTHVLPSWLGGRPPQSSMSGGCVSGWQVYAQNRWTPVGAAVRAQPTTDSKKIDVISPNIPVTVDGWTHREVAYPDNVSPFNGDIWLHRKSGGWISFAGVRAVPTQVDPTLQSSDGGIPATLPDDCKAKAD